MDTLLFAKAYSKQGWQSFPCRPHDKTPLVKWADVATTEENMLVGWWDNFPDANIGIACGKRSGIVVLDVDAGHGGYDSLTKLIDQYGPLPETPVSKTGSGGEHVFFKHPGIEIRNSASKLGRRSRISSAVSDTYMGEFMTIALASSNFSQSSLDILPLIIDRLGTPSISKKRRNTCFFRISPDHNNTGVSSCLANPLPVSYILPTAVYKAS